MILPLFLSVIALHEPQQHITAPKEPCGMHEPKCGCFARSCVCAKGGAFQFESLWWRAENHGFSYALNEMSGGAFSGNADAGNNIGSLVRIYPDWDPGFRIGFGWNMDYDRWDLFANWTWYKNAAQTTNLRSDLTQGGVSNEGFYPQWPVAQGTSQGPYRRVYGRWRFAYNAIDLELGRAFFLTKAITCRPFWGVRGAWLHQRFISSFTQPLQLGIDTKQDFHGKNHWWGLGPRLGFQSEWTVWHGIRVLGRASGSLLYGQTNIRTLFESQSSGSSVLATDRMFQENFYQLVPNVQLFMGAGWGACLCRNKLYFSADAGWETSYWWNQFNLPIVMRTFTAPLPTISNQPVSMEGLTLRFHLDF